MERSLKLLSDFDMCSVPSLAIQTWLSECEVDAVIVLMRFQSFEQTYHCIGWRPDLAPSPPKEKH
eukprot:6459118-Amphidinium_carterae.1